MLAGSKHPQRLTAESDSVGIATFSWPVAPGDNGVDYFRVWADGGGGRPGEWDEYQDAWSMAHHVHGRTVAVRVENDVANAEVGSPGRIRLLRTGFNSFAAFDASAPDAVQDHLGNAVLKLDADTVVIITGVSSASLTESDFLWI